MLVLIDEWKLRILRKMTETKKSTRGKIFHIFDIQKDESSWFQPIRCRQMNDWENREIGIRYEWLKVVNNG